MENDNIYLFFREDGFFYPISLANDAVATANAECNPGTERVEDAVTKKVIWTKPNEN